MTYTVWVWTEPHEGGHPDDVDLSGCDPVMRRLYIKVARMEQGLYS